MGNWSHHPNGEWRNEGWTYNGSGVSKNYHAWNNDDNTKYMACPSHKGRSTCSFPVDISDVPEGAVITSITVKLKCSKQDSGRHCIEVNLIPQDSESTYYTRNIYPTQTITEYEIATYRFDPRKRPWDKHRINKILCQVRMSKSGSAGRCRCHRFYCVINYRVRPTVEVTAPTGTVTTPSPTVSWTYSQTDGDPQAKADYKIFTAIQQEAPDFNADTTTPVYSNTVQGDTTSFILPTALTPDSYYVYVRAHSSFTAKSVWSSRAFTVQGAAPGVPGGGPGGGGASVGAGAGAGFVSVVPDTFNSSAYLTLRDGSNLLSVEAANFENTSDTLGYTTSNCSATRDTTQTFTGTASMKITSSSAADMFVLSNYIEIAPSTAVTAVAQFKAATIARTCTTQISFYDADFASAGGTLSSSAADSTSTFTEVAVTGTTPATAVYAKVVLLVTAPGSGESHYIDGVGLMYGTDSVWSHGGHASRNLLSAVASTADDPLIGSEPWTAGSAAVAYTRTTTAGTGSEGAKRFRLTYTGTTPSISFVAMGTAYSDTSSSTGFTLNKPAGVQDNDLLLAFIASDEDSSVETPTGWTFVNSAKITTGTEQVALHILKRTGLAADPSTWVGNLSSSTSRRRAIVAAYRGTADSALQFVTEKVATSGSGSTAITTATVNNTVQDSWRIAAFAARDDATGATMIANKLPPSTVPPIQFVGAATQWTATNSDVTSFTINKPSGVVNADLMLAFVGVSDPDTPTITAPSGWTIVRQFAQTDDNADTTMCVMKRTAGSSEPSSWTGTFSTGVKPVVTQVVAYRYADTAANQFIAENQSLDSSGSTIATASVTNTNSLAWRVCAFAAGDEDTSSFTSNEVSERCDDSSQYYTSSGWSGTDNIRASTVAVYDSNGPVTTGSHSRTGTLDESFYAAVSWIGIIKPLPTPPAPGGNETERTDGTTGSADPWVTLSVYDSAGVAATGNQSITGVVTPGSGTTIDAAASWIGIVKPAAPIVAGEASARLTDYIDISTVDPAVLELADNKVTFQASFLGSLAGTPFLTVEFYTGNELISSQTMQGESFNTTVWTKSTATFDIPEGTTRFKAVVSVQNFVVNDIVYYDRVSLSLGDSTIWRAGTGGAEHPIFSIPVVEYADDLGDGYGEWNVLPGTVSSPLVYDQLTGLATWNDQTLIPLANRKYRAKTLSYGLAGDTFISAYGPESNEVSLVAQHWWLKDLQDPSKSMKLEVSARSPIDAPTTGSSAVFQPLGEDLPVVLTEGYKGDRIEITAQVYRSDFAKLRELLNTGRTLFLQSKMDNGWWVRPVGDIGTSTMITSQFNTNPLRFVDLTFVQVDPEL